jgi:hypothetical protein
MKQVICLVLGVALAGVTGCRDQGTAVAPSTDPGRPKETRELRVTSPGDQTVTQDQTNEMTVRINRDNFDGPIEIDLQNLPNGVQLVTQERTIPAGESSIKLTIRADATAPVVENHRVTVVARAPGQADLRDARVDFNVTVRQKD